VALLLVAAAFDVINDAFQWLSPAAIIEHSILCVHGGIGRIKWLRQLDSLRKPCAGVQDLITAGDDRGPLLTDVLYATLAPALLSLVNISISDGFLRMSSPDGQIQLRVPVSRKQARPWTVQTVPSATEGTMMHQAHRSLGMDLTA
jgi:hypothetical protein